MDSEWTYNLNVKIPHSPPTSSDFPVDILRFMKKNASPKQILNLMQSIKYFLPPKFPFFVFRNFCRRKYKLNEIEKFAENLWLKGNFNILGRDDIAFTLLSKAVVCDISSMTLSDVDILFEDFKKLVKFNKVRFAHFELNFKVVYGSGEIVPWEVIFSHLSSIKYFCW